MLIIHSLDPNPSLARLAQRQERIRDVLLPLLACGDTWGYRFFLRQFAADDDGFLPALEAQVRRA